MKDTERLRLLYQNDGAFGVGVIVGKQETVERAVEWIKNNWREYVYQDGDGIVHFGHWENDFRKAMEK